MSSPPIDGDVTVTYEKRSLPLLDASLFDWGTSIR